MTAVQRRALAETFNRYTIEAIIMTSLVACAGIALLTMINYARYRTMGELPESAQPHAILTSCSVIIPVMLLIWTVGIISDYRRNLKKEQTWENFLTRCHNPISQLVGRRRTSQRPQSEAGDPPDPQAATEVPAQGNSGSAAPVPTPQEAPEPKPKDNGEEAGGDTTQSDATTFPRELT